MTQGELPEASPDGGRGSVRVAVGVAAVLAVVYIGLLAGVPKEVFWITDGGNRFIQTQSVERGEVDAFAVEYPGRELDPDLVFVPRGGHHFQVRDGSVVSFYLPYFSRLVAPLHSLLGPVGLYLAPLLAAIVCGLLFPTLLGLVGVDRWRAGWTLVFGLGTPLLFYALTFWEHTLQMAASLGAMVVLWRPPSDAAADRRSWRAVALAGLLLGLATVFREEGYVLVASAAVADFWVRRSWRRSVVLGAGFAGVMAPLWGVQWLVYGSPLGLHSAVYGGATGGAAALTAGGGLFARLLAEAGDLYFYLLRFHTDAGWSALLTVPFVLALAAGFFEGARQLRLPLAVLSATCCLVLVASLVSDPLSIAMSVHHQGLFPNLPLLVLMLLGLRGLLRSERPAVRGLTLTALGYLLLVSFPLHREDVGIIWGPRHFLPVIPLLVALSAVALVQLIEAAEREWVRRAFVVCGGVLAVLGVAIQAKGVVDLRLKKLGTQYIAEEVASADGAAVVSDVYWLAEELAVLYYRRPFFEVGSGGALREITRRLRAVGEERAVVVLSPLFRRMGDAARAALFEAATERLLLRPPGLPHMELAVLSVDLARLEAVLAGE